MNSLISVELNTRDQRMSCGRIGIESAIAIKKDDKLRFRR